MTSIPSHTPAVSTSPAVAPSGAETGGDLLGAMRPAMDRAFAVGMPTNVAGANAVLATGASYVHGAAATIARLDDGLAKRRAELEQLRQGDPAAGDDLARQVDMLQRLRDRIQLSMERVGDILAGRDRDDIGAPDEQEQLHLLQERRRLLAPSGADAFAPGNPGAVAGTYAATTATAASSPS